MNISLLVDPLMLYSWMNEDELYMVTSNEIAKLFLNLGLADKLSPLSSTCHLCSLSKVLNLVHLVSSI